MEQVAGPDWSSLPADLLAKLAGALVDDIVDLYAFRAVCISWRAAARQLRGAITSRSPLQAKLSRQAELTGETIILHDPTRNRRLPGITSGDFRGYFLCGSSHGCLILFKKVHPDKSAAEIILLDVATCFTVHLPPFYFPSTWDRFEPYRVILSAPLRSPTGCTVVFFYTLKGHELLYCRPGDAKWRNCYALSTYAICDMLFVQGTLYTLLVTADIDGCQLATVHLPGADDIAGDKTDKAPWQHREPFREA